MNVVPDYPLRDRSADALQRLGVPREKTLGLPPINKLLKEQSRSGISGAIEAMRMSDGEISRQFLETYDQIPERDKESLTMEVIAVAAGVDPRALLGEILLAAREYSVVKFKLRAYESHADILERQIEFAKSPGGQRDRADIHTILGALPRNKSTFIDKVYLASNESKDDDADDGKTIEAVQQVEEMVEDESFIFPDSEAIQDKIQPIRAKILETKR